MIIVDTPLAAADRGTSLLELLTAMALSAAIAGTALLGYRSMLAQWRLSAAARQVVMDLKVARTRAITQSAAQRIHFAIADRRYQRQREVGARYTDDGPPTALPDGVETRDCTARGGNIAFQPRGHASSFGSVTLVNRDGAQRRIVVDIAGRVRVE